MSDDFDPTKPPQLTRDQRSTRFLLASAARLWGIVAALGVFAAVACVFVGLFGSGRLAAWFVTAGNALIGALVAWTIGLFVKAKAESL